MQISCGVFWSCSAKKYKFCLSKLLDEHAPSRTKVVANRPRLPWFNSDIRSAITARRRAERKWRSSKQPDYLAEFKKAKNYETMLVNKAKISLFDQPY